MPDLLSIVHKRGKAMSELMHEAPITDLKIIQGSLNAAGAALASLAVAESLTDPVALRLLSVCGIENPENFLQVIHVCDFVELLYGQVRCGSNA